MRLLATLRRSIEATDGHGLVATYVSWWRCWPMARRGGSSPPPMGSEPPTDLRHVDESTGGEDEEAAANTSLAIWPPIQPVAAEPKRRRGAPRHHRARRWGGGGGTPSGQTCGGEPPIHSPSTSRATTRADRGRGLWRLASEQPPTAAGDDVLVERWQWRVRCVLWRGEHDAALALGRQRTELEEEGCRAGAKPGFEISGVWGEDKP